jgi:hypothetical protein
LNLKCNKLLSGLAFKFNSRRYIKDVAECVTVSVGAGADFPSAGAGVGVSPAVAGAYDLSGAGGMAVEAWLKPQELPTDKASVVYKGGPARSGDSIKVGRCRLTLSNPRRKRLEQSA